MKWRITWDSEYLPIISLALTIYRKLSWEHVYLTQGYDNNEFTDDGLFNVAVGSMYIREYFAVEKKKEALKQVEYIRKTFEYLVPHISWMDQKTKTKSIDKLRAMGQFIAYPDELRDRSIMDHYYRGL